MTCDQCGQPTFTGAYAFDGEVVAKTEWEQVKAYVIRDEDGFVGGEYGFGPAIGVLADQLPAPRLVWVTKSRSFMSWDDEPEWLEFCKLHGERE